MLANESVPAGSASASCAAIRSTPSSATRTSPPTAESRSVCHAPAWMGCTVFAPSTVPPLNSVTPPSALSTAVYAPAALWRTLSRAMLLNCTRICTATSSSVSCTKVTGSPPPLTWSACPSSLVVSTQPAPICHRYSSPVSKLSVNSGVSAGSVG